MEERSDDASSVPQLTIRCRTHIKTSRKNPSRLLQYVAIWAALKRFAKC
jgi:hypothetical protein